MDWIDHTADRHRVALMHGRNQNQNEYRIHTYVYIILYMRVCVCVCVGVCVLWILVISLFALQVCASFSVKNSSDENAVNFKIGIMDMIRFACALRGGLINMEAL